MEIKKSPQADLENKRGSFILIGLVMVLSILFIAFEWTQTEVSESMDLGIETVVIEEEMVSTEQEEEEPEVEEPEPEQIEEIVEPEIKIVENDVKTEALNIKSSEDDNQAVDFTPTAPVIEEEEEESNEIFDFAKVEKMPEFPGGMQALMKYLSSNINYPQDAIETGIYGRVYISFVVEKDGSITDVQVTRSVHPSLDKEAARVVKNMPKWAPGKQLNKPVRVRYTLPVNFRLK